jgi:hypothetical protein
MNNDTMKALRTVLTERYETTLEACDVCALEWSVDYLVETRGLEFGARAFRRANAYRHARGLYTRIPQYGSPLYTAYFSKA